MAQTSTFPERDEHGRIVRLTDLLAYAVVGVVISVLALALVDGAFVLLGSGHFGDVNGWLALILPAIIFVEQFRAAAPGPSRWLVLLVSAAAGIVIGGLAAGLTAGLARILSGALGALVATVIFAVLWYVGSDRLARR